MKGRDRKLVDGPSTWKGSGGIADLCQLAGIGNQLASSELVYVGAGVGRLTDWYHIYGRNAGAEIEVGGLGSRGFNIFYVRSEFLPIL